MCLKRGHFQRDRNEAHRYPRKSPVQRELPVQGPKMGVGLAGIEGAYTGKVQEAKGRVGGKKRGQKNSGAP